MRRLFTMPPQVLRVCLLAVGIVVLYIIARSFMTPPTFGQYGWYRGDALEELRKKDTVYAGKMECVETCHTEVGQKLSKGPHQGLSCEACHGVDKPGSAKAHAENPAIQIEQLKPKEKPGTAKAEAATPATETEKHEIEKREYSRCVRCHEANPSRPKWHKQVVSKSHYTGSLCSECHLAHNPSEVP